MGRIDVSVSQECQPEGLSSKPQSALLWLHMHRLESEDLTETHKSLLLPGQPTSWFKAIQESERWNFWRVRRGGGI